MGSSRNLGLAFLVLILLCNGSMAQSGCTNVLIGMASCLNYVTGSSKTPSSSCCSSLANVVKSQPMCLCTALDGSGLAALGISINKSIALALPGACNVKTPPVSRCDGGNRTPVMAPAKSPENSDEGFSNGPSPTSSFEAGSKEVLVNGKTSDTAVDVKMHGMLSSSIVVMLVLLL